jgi:hypothetical protein
MSKMLRIAFLLMLVGLTAACVSIPKGRMQATPENAITKAPPPGKALIYFMRTSQYGGVMPADLYDGETYVGSITFGEHIAYPATPGQHLFMVVGETAEFMPSELLAGKTYYANVGAHMGMWKARFHFSPQNGNLPQGELNSALNAGRQVVLTEEGRRWAAENAADVHKLKVEHLPKWEQGGQRAKQTLNAASGR